MIKRAEEAAMAAYPYLPSEFNTFEHKTVIVDGNASNRGLYIQGYEQAEKDLALTWEDIAFICQTCTEVINSLPNKPCPYTPGFKDVYGEVLKRFNELRNKQ